MRNAPHGNGALQVTTGEEVPASVPQAHPRNSDAALFEAVIDGVHVVVVKTSHDRYRRRVYLSLAAADRAAERARERGHEAAVVLCRLTPVRAGWVR